MERDKDRCRINLMNELQEFLGYTSEEVAQYSSQDRLLEYDLIK